MRPGRWVLWATLLGAGESPPAATQPASRPASPMQVQAQRFFREGARLFRQESYHAAIVALRASIQLDPAAAHVARAREYLAAIENEGQSRLSMARELLEQERYLLASEQFQSVMEEFAGLEPAAAARREASALAARPEYVAAKRSADADALLKKARTHEQAGEHYFASLGYERLAEDYAQTPAGQAGAKRLREMRADPGLRDLIERQKAEQEAAEWFAVAENYRRNAERLTGAARQRFLASAREFYNRILSTHPTCPQAAQARAALAQLDKSEE